MDDHETKRKLARALMDRILYDVLSALRRLHDPLKSIPPEAIDDYRMLSVDELWDQIKLKSQTQDFKMALEIALILQKK